MITETIASVKNVIVAGVEKAIVTTKSGQTVWVNKDQVSDKAETISYNAHKAGSKYTTKDGTVGERKTDQNEFVGCGKMSKLEVLDYLISKGINPTFSLS